MTRLFSILIVFIVIGLVLWCGQRYFVAHLHGVGFWDSLASHLGSAKPDDAVATSKSGDHTINECRSTLQVLSQNTLRPLRENNDFSTADATRILQNTQRDLGKYRSHPDYAHLMQGCDLVARALQDRQMIVQRLENGAALPSMTSATRLMASGELSQFTGSPILGTISNFFEKRALKDWDERCDYYKPLLDRLLIPST